MILDTRNMGSAGAAIEYEAHKKTLELLRRARTLLLKSHDYSLPEVQKLFQDIKEQCPVLAEED